MTSRLSLALDSGGLSLPEEGRIAVFLPQPGADLSGLPRDRVQLVQPFRPHLDHFRDLGFEVVPEAEGDCAAAILFLPRAKAQIRAMIHQACRRSSGVVVVDGAKTDGIDSILRDLRKRVDVQGPIAKAHGKIFWFQADAAAVQDWAAPDTTRAEGFVTAPGVFSADGIDPASRLLADTLPAKLGKAVADLGAGWGYLSARILQDDGVQSLDLVEADHAALNCARANIDDPRARFHWADATTWKAPNPVDMVVMNPPFHTSRNADPALGRAFIEAAARMLTPNGTLWLVANRHLPYESTLSACFAQVVEEAGDNRFKVYRATRPIRARR